MPIIETADKIRELEIGQVLEVLADDKGIRTDMPAWCESTGNELLGIEEEDGEYRVYVRKRAE
jgi:TusA-related sulfurtransferase